MSGALSACLATTSTYLIVGVADVGGGVYGFQSGSGTINGLTSAQDPPLRTAIITTCRAINGGIFPFTFAVFGVVSQTFFKRLLVQETDGTSTLLLASDATFTTPGGTHSEWEWEGDAALWTAAGTRTVEVHL